MAHLRRLSVFLLSLGLLWANCSLTSGQQQQAAQRQQQPVQQQKATIELQPNDLPYYMSPLLLDTNRQQEPLPANNERVAQRSQLPRAVQVGRVKLDSTQRGLDSIEPELQGVPRTPSANSDTGCLYDRSYFAKLDECLARKPYPAIGLPAFKNDDLVVKRGLSDRQGCLFVLNSGLFKSYQIPKYSIDSDSQCLDNSKVGLTMSFNNISLSYLWSLRCLNRADQLLDDATLAGETSVNGAGATSNQNANVCVGSSQNFGFASMQLSGIEAQLELAMDIYKNWRVTNVTVAMLNPGLLPTSRSAGQALDGEQQNVLGTTIKDFVFESLDGDELNWRYLNLFQNWSRNRMHSNFLDQYRRFIWISLQRCLSEYTEKLPVKLMDIFSGQKTN